MLKRLKRRGKNAWHRLGKGISDRLPAELDLLRTLVWRDLEAKYKGSILGNLWPLVNQLFQLLIYTYVFSIVLQVKLSLNGAPESRLTFGLWLFAGLVPWNAFTAGLFQASSAVINQSNLVKKVVFPLRLLPLVPVLSAFMESLIGLGTLCLAIALSSGLPWQGLWLLPLAWGVQLMLAAGLAYLSSGLTVFLRDIPQTIGVLLNLWFYLTPIVYPSHVIPQPWQRWVMLLNPMAAIAETYRDALLIGSAHHATAGAIAALIAAGILVAGYWTYQRLSTAFADVL